MYASLHSAALEGLQVHDVEIEVSTGRGLPGMVMVGLAGKAVTESRDRVKTALQHSDMPYPRSKVTVNLAPGDLKKEGTLYDLPIAIGTMICTEFLKPKCNLSQMLIVGECALSGQCRGVQGILSIAEACHTKGFQLICPAENAAEASLVEGLEIFPVASLHDVVKVISGQITSSELFAQQPSIAPEPQVMMSKDKNFRKERWRLPRQEDTIF
jgi:magnesium chelatase family protein